MNHQTVGGSALPSGALAGPWPFFAVAYGWTWSFWWPAAALGTAVDTVAGETLLLLGLLGPLAAGVVLTALTRGARGWRDEGLRLVDPRRIGPAWSLVILLFAPVLMALALGLETAASGGGALALVEARVAPLVAAPGTALPFALGVLVHGPLTEEPGWRGYALDRLQARRGALGASLILGLFWAFWHLPLFFIEGTIHHARGAGSPWFWEFLAVVFPMAVILTWIYNHTGRSILAAILFHFTVNATYVVANVTAGTNRYAALLWILAAAAVTLFWGPATLTRRPRWPTIP